MKIAIDLGGTGLKIGGFESGTMVREIEKKSPGTTMNCDESIDYIADAIREFDLSHLEGIGIGVPSVVDAERGIVYDVVNIPSWKCVPIGGILSERFRTTVKVNNDANCFALGELEFGSAAGYRDVVGVTLGTGLGVGVITGGKLYNGANTGAGELGNAPYLNQNYEYYCSGNFFTALYGVSGKELSVLASEGDPVALRVWGEFGHHLGEFLKLVLYAYDPQIIVIGGSVAKGYNFFNESMRSAIGTFLYKNTLKNLVITPSALSNAGIMGALALLG